MHIAIIMIVIFLITVIYKATLNFFRYRRLTSLKNTYEKYITQKSDWLIHENQQEIIELFKKAGLKDPQVLISEMIDPMNVSNAYVSLFDNMMKFKGAIINNMHSFFCQAIGVYKKRCFDSINPLYWIDFVLFLPQKIIIYLGLDQGSKVAAAIVKTINVIYWVSSIGATFIKLMHINFV
ncbi:MAG: hypothetical protein WAW86_10660 [Gammaproteobacteria bacterium]